MQKSKIPIYVFAIMGFIVSIVGYQFSQNWEKQRIASSFQNDVEKIFFTIRKNVELNLSTLESIKSFYKASQKVERTEFKEFSKYILKHHTGIQALEWIPLVKNEERSRYVEQATLDGFAGFQITEKNEQGLMVKAGQRNEYYPVYFVEPMEGNEKAFGFDLASNRTRLSSLLKARDSGMMVATARITLVQEEGDQYGFLVFNPIYRNGSVSETLEQRRKNLIGFVLGVFRVGDMLNPAVNPVQDKNISVYLSDVTKAQESQTLHSFTFQKSNTRNDSDSIKIRNKFLQNVLTAENILTVGERRWKIQCIALENYGANINSGQSLLIFAIGILTTLFFVGYLKFNIDRRILTEQSKMDSMVESIQEGVIMFDTRGEVLVCNPQAYKMFDISDRERNIQKVLNKKIESVSLRDSIEKSRQKDEIIQKEIVIPGNKNQILLCNICPVQSKNRRLGTAIILRDISLEKEVDNAKTEFISTVSHELRTPLAITKEGLSLILDKIAGDITEKQEMILNTAQDNISRLSRLINNLLDISKIEAGKMEVRNAKVDIVALTKKVFLDFELKADEKKLGLLLNYPDLPIDVFADRDKIIQVFTNLISNALKFTAEGHVGVSAKSLGEFIEFTVTDTGIGITEENLQRTFNKFQQFGRAIGVGEKGTGLGLSIAKGIVEMHGGTIKVESKLGEGTKFIFTLRKFSEDLPLQEFIQSRITEAQKTAEHLSLVMVNFQEIKNSHQHYPVEKQQQHLKTIENLLNADLHRERDSTFRDGRRCAALIANCDKGHINIVYERIKGTMARYVAQEGLDGKVDLKVRCAIYPDDARNSVGLLNKVKVV